MRRLLSGILGAIVALFSIVVTLFAGIVVVSAKMSTAKGVIGWDPISLARNSPGTIVAVFVLILAIPGLGFTVGYRLQAR